MIAYRRRPLSPVVCSSTLIPSPVIVLSPVICDVFAQQLSLQPTARLSTHSQRTLVPCLTLSVPSHHRSWLACFYSSGHYCPFSVPPTSLVRLTSLTLDGLAIGRLATFLLVFPTVLWQFFLRPKLFLPLLSTLTPPFFSAPNYATSSHSPVRLAGLVFFSVCVCLN